MNGLQTHPNASHPKGPHGWKATGLLVVGVLFLGVPVTRAAQGPLPAPNEAHEILLGRWEERITELLDSHYRVSDGLSPQTRIENEQAYWYWLGRLDEEMKRLAVLMEQAQNHPDRSSEELSRSLDRAEALLSNVRLQLDRF